jgi:hypothetical protein
MAYLLAIAAVAMVAVLVVQTMRGRVAPRCCALPPEQDVRLREASAPAPPADARPV